MAKKNKPNPELAEILSTIENQRAVDDDDMLLAAGKALLSDADNTPSVPNTPSQDDSVLDVVEIGFPMDTIDQWKTLAKAQKMSLEAYIRMRAEGYNSPAEQFQKMLKGDKKPEVIPQPTETVPQMPPISEGIEKSPVSPQDLSQFFKKPETAAPAKKKIPKWVYWVVGALLVILVVGLLYYFFFKKRKTAKTPKKIEKTVTKTEAAISAPPPVMDNTLPQSSPPTSILEDELDIKTMF